MSLYLPLGNERVYLPFYDAEDTPFHIQGDVQSSRRLKMTTLLNSSHCVGLRSVSSNVVCCSFGGEVLVTFIGQTGSSVNQNPGDKFS